MTDKHIPRVRHYNKTTKHVARSMTWKIEKAFGWNRFFYNSGVGNGSQRYIVGQAAQRLIDGGYTVVYHYPYPNVTMLTAKIERSRQ